MSGPYIPGRLSEAYHSLPSTERAKVADEVDRRFSKQTGVTRSLDPTSATDLILRREWLRIRDEVMGERELEEDRERRRDEFVEDLVAIVLDDMTAKGWKEAVALLETWSKRPVAEKPKYTAPVTSVVKMDWVLGFSRAKSVYDAILKDRIWTNDASQKRIAAFLKATPRTSGQAFGDLSRAVEKVDDEWINSRPVVGGLLDYDGLAGALGSFHLQVAVAGKLIWITPTGFQLAIEEVGIYAKDSFDFSSNDFLGFWGYRDDPVYDSDFRMWRTKHKAGGDFLVYSDIKRTKLTSPDLVTGSL
jgi:hypothetical protein